MGQVKNLLQSTTLEGVDVEYLLELERCMTFLVPERGVVLQSILEVHSHGIVTRNDVDTV